MLVEDTHEQNYNKECKREDVSLALEHGYTSRETATGRSPR